MIEIKDVMKSFENKNVLNHLNVTISSGSIFGLIGPNGAGKSTLLYLLNGISKCDEGSILFDGKEVYENPDVKKDILFISDDPYYFHFATIDEMKDFYLTFYPQFNLETYQHYVDLFRLPQNKPLKDYSKGMKRQAMFALALAIAPKYLLLDEAFDGLDPVMRLAFKKAINQMIDENMTVIISSHNLRELEDICDSFGILENGCMTTSGDLYDIKDHVHKIQIAFKEELNKEEFSHLDVLSFHKQSRVINMVVKGDINEIKDYLRMFNPIMLEVLPVNLEEIFIYEMESNPSDVESYYNFMSDFKLPDISSMVRTLYSLSELEPERADDAINSLIKRNYELMDKHEADKNKDEISTMKFAEYIPTIFVSFKIAVDMMLVVAEYL